MQLTKNFQHSEFACNCGCGQMPDPNDLEFKMLVAKLQNVRDECGFPLHITSGYRCPKQNKKVGGVKDSSHLAGLAVDIAVESDFTRLLFLRSAVKYFGRIGIANKYIHVDVDVTKDDAIWVY